ncbi:MAG: hypothetical protein R3221_04440, partial [Spongiibacter sp.]|nr:hypothetical protein [Spongiibacter sp.]
MEFCRHRAGMPRPPRTAPERRRDIVNTTPTIEVPVSAAMLEDLDRRLEAEDSGDPAVLRRALEDAERTLDQRFDTGDDVDT